LRHEKILKEMKKRGYREASPLDKRLAKGKARQDVFINTKKEQKEILRNKKCPCFSK